MLTRTLFCVVLSTATTVVFAQSNTPVTLRWKLQPNEDIRYKTIIQAVDTSDNIAPKFNWSKSFFPFHNNDSSEKVVIDSLLKETYKAMEKTNIVTALSEQKPGVIDILMAACDSNGTRYQLRNLIKDSSGKNKLKEHEIMEMLTDGVKLRGAIYEDGSMQSFYVKNDQRNLISLFFELPGQAVSVGDHWPLHINFISMDQNFKCDSSYRENQVTLIGLKKSGTDVIAMLKYDICEYVSGDFNVPMSDKAVKSSMSMVLHSFAEFSITRGRLLSYDGIMSNKATGIMEAQFAQRVALSLE